LRSSGQAQWTGYCNPKGRLFFTGWLARTASASDEFALLIDRSLSQAVAKRLKMFVLRSKVTIEDLSDRYVLQGTIELPTATHTQPADPTPALSIGLPIAHTLMANFGRSVQCLDTQAQAKSMEASVNSEDFSGVWRWLHLLAAEPWITQTLSERFVPQMLNFERLGGVNFRKGCYPGQEVVARSQYLGRLKRRSGIYQIDDPSRRLPAEGEDLGEASNPDLSVVNVLRCPGSLGMSLWQSAFAGMPAHAQAAHALVLAEGRIDLEGSPLGPSITLPYALSDDA
ncbi:MAG: YgfZ/GcvT domain-containing protein, partial [Betaproteobacteria bacterium]